MMKKRKILSILLALVMCAGLAACANEGGVSSDGEVTSKNVVLTESWEFDSGFYPVVSAATASNHGITYWTHNFYDTLVRYTPKGEIEGSLAESWSVSEDGMTYTFKLREGVKFSDGTPLNADAVKTSFEASIENLGIYNGSYGKLTALIDSMEAAADNTFVLTLTSPYYGALNDLSMCCPLGIVNPAAFEGGADKVYENLSAVTMGTGPYMYEGDFDGTTYTFVRNPYYWGELPEADTFQVKVIPENESKVMALRNGEIDGVLGATRLSYSAFSDLSEETGFGTSVSEISSQTRYLGFNLNEAPFNDDAVREAVAYAIDQQALETSVFNGIETAAESLFPSDKLYCDVETATWETDIEIAGQTLGDGGWVDSDGDGVREKNGEALEIEISYTQSLGTIDDAVLAIKSQLEAVGFSVSVKGSDMMSWYGDIMAGNYTAVLWYTHGGVFDPINVVTNMNPAVSADPIAVQFAAFMKNPDILEEVNSTSDTTRVKEIYREILQTIANEALLVPVSYAHETFAYRNDVVLGYTFGYDSNYVDVASIDLN